ncbi:MAG: hypothetical protein JNK94_05915, partial [Hyphomonadaceae bacterium]|nr:hypothetical protein [Hyphomonadaceae bacterium]
MAFDANDLSPHEHFVVERTRLGEIADFSPLGGADGSKPGVRAGFLRRLMLGLEAEWRAPATGLRIRGARIDGALDLSDCSGETLPALTLDQCVIADVIDISHARLARLALTGCAVRRVAAGGAHIGGDLDLSGARPLGPPGKEALTVDLRGADIGGALLFSGAKLARGDSGHEALIAEGARVV